MTTTGSDAATGDSATPTPVSNEALERAKKAERELRELKAAHKAREDADAKAKRDADMKDLDSARRQADELAARERAATEEAAALRRLIEGQVKQRLDKLPESERERVSKYKEKLSLADWSQLVDDEVARVGGKQSDTDSDSDGSTQNTVNPPPPGATGINRIQDTRGQGRRLRADSEEVLGRMGVDTTAAKKGLEVEKDGEKAKFVYPPKKLISLMRERAIGPKVLSNENYVKLFG